MGKRSRQPIVLLRASLDPYLYEGLVNESTNLGWRVINLHFGRNYIPSGQTPMGAIVEEPLPDLTVAHLRQHKAPIVALSLRGDIECDAFVLADRAGAGRLAAQALSERGFKDLGYVSFDTSEPEDLLFVGFNERATSKAGTAVHVCNVVARRGGHAGADHLNKYMDQVRTISEWLQRVPRPVGILAYNFRMALRITDACETAGLAMPEEVAVVCRGDLGPLCDTAPVPLSSIDMNREEQGRRAVRLLKELSRGKPLPEKPIHVPAKGFVERRSTDIVAIPDLRVAKAVRFIWDHAASPLGVEEVARELGISSNTLQRAFNRALGRTVNAEIRRRRLENSKALLRGTTMSMDDIAKTVGFGSRRYLHLVFKEALGMTPNQYRSAQNMRSLGSDPGKSR